MAQADMDASPATGASGQAKYEQTCVSCHGANGKGAFSGVPDLTSKYGRLAKPDAELMRNMVNGFQSPGSPMAMPPKGGNAGPSDSNMKNVLKYLRDAFGS